MLVLRQILFLAFLLVTPSSLFGEAQCPGNVLPVRYHSLGRSQIAIEVVLNHKGPYEFMVDTGSQMTVIEPSLAAELELQPAGTVQVISGLRSAPGMLVSPDLIEAGSNAVHLSRAVVQSLAQFQSLYPELRGILGEDFLMGFDILLDRGKRILCLDSSTDMRREVRGERISMVHWNGTKDETQTAHPIIIPARLTNDPGRAMHLRLDSGASTPILYANRVEQEPWSDRLRTHRGSVAGGSTMYFKALAPQDIEIGKHVMNDITFVAPVRTSQDVTVATEDGLLPTSLFKRVFISYRGDYVVLEPR